VGSVSEDDNDGGGDDDDDDDDDGVSFPVFPCNGALVE
jgi:hypothetical protein